MTSSKVWSIGYWQEVLRQGFQLLVSSIRVPHIDINHTPQLKSFCLTRIHQNTEKLILQNILLITGQRVLMVTRLFLILKCSWWFSNRLLRAMRAWIVINFNIENEWNTPHSIILDYFQFKHHNLVQTLTINLHKIVKADLK